MPKHRGCNTSQAFVFLFFFEKFIQVILCVCTHKTGTSCVFLMLCVDLFPLVISAFLLVLSLWFFQRQSQNST